MKTIYTKNISTNFGNYSKVVTLSDNAVTCFEDLQLQEIKNKINEYSKNKVDIKTTLSTNRFYYRFYKHLIGSKIVKNAVIKYGINNFALIILELFPEEVYKENNKKLLNI